MAEMVGIAVLSVNLVGLLAIIAAVSLWLLGAWRF